MAPIPRDSKQNPSNEDDSEIDMFSNPNLAVTPGLSDSSDENDEEFSNLPSSAGYTLLSQEPGIGDDDDEDDDSDSEGNFSRISAGDAEKDIGSRVVDESCNVNQVTDSLAETVIRSEVGTSSGRTVPTANSSCHPSFLSKFPADKMPAYMQVSPMSQEPKEQLWNQKRQEKTPISMDLGNESSILKAMAGFSLPKEHVPEWAQNLADDQWKHQVLNKISPEERPATEKSSEKHGKAGSDQSGQGQTALNPTEPDWVATFPDS